MKNQIVAAATGLLLVSSAYVQSAPANRTEFEGFIHFCTSGPPDKVIVTPGGKTQHIRGSIKYQRVGDRQCIHRWAGEQYSEH